MVKAAPTGSGDIPFAIVYCASAALPSTNVWLRRYLTPIAVVVAIVVVGALLGLSTNVVSSEKGWPAWLELVRRHPWLAWGTLLLVAAVLSVVAVLRPVSHMRSDRPQRLAPVGDLLPAQPIYEGREQERRTLVSAVRAGRLVHVITGMPGVGKTAFAIFVARKQARRFRHGQLLVELRAHANGDPGLTAAEVMATLLVQLGVPRKNLPANGGDATVLPERGALLRAAIAGRRMVFVLDDAGDPAQVVPVLPYVTGCLVLVTSRRMLAGLGGEASMRLPVLSPAQSTALFRRGSGRSFGPEDRGALDELMRLCAGLPLAIVLQAGRLARHDKWTVADVAGTLRESHDRLGHMGDDERTVAAAFDASYHHLGDVRRQLFRWLGTHPGPDIDVDAAAALHGDTVTQTRRHLEGLYGANLLEETKAGRYQLHDLIGEYTRSIPRSQTEAAEQERALDRLFEYYRRTTARACAHIERDTPAEESDTPTEGSDARARAVAWLTVEWGNLRAWLTHLEYCHDDRRTVALTAAMAAFLRHTGPYREAIALHTKALEAAQRIGDPLGQAHALRRKGTLQYLASVYTEAEQSLQRALTLYRGLGHRLGQAHALLYLGTVQRMTGQTDRAIDNLEQARALYHDQRDRLGQANALSYLGATFSRAHRLDDATAPLQEALDLHRQLHDRQGEANALNMLGTIQYMTSRLSTAAQTLQEALSLYRDLGDQLGQANALNNLGVVWRLHGDFPAAAKAQRDALAIRIKLGDRGGQANALNNLAAIGCLTGDYQAAAGTVEQALSIARDFQSWLAEANALSSRGTIMRLRGDLAAADRDQHQALDMYRTHRHPLGEANALHEIGLIKTATGQYQAAAEALNQGLHIYNGIPNPEGRADMLHGLGIVKCLTGEYDAARDELQQAHGIYRELRQRPGVVATLNSIAALDLATGEAARAQRGYRDAGRLARDIRSIAQQARSAEGMARCAHHLGHRWAARWHLHRARRMFRHMGADADIARGF